ncbi:phosphoribosylaminoimidazolesuccinocarboxamide synthase, partial [Achromobacter insuavis]|uniref:phosphoribosylaminoimidazolesuccinocarboxamide synthase n=1 Tax=Achromobacter insuavis TaxID=1287735 RepID=UPI0035A1CB0B
MTSALHQSSIKSLPLLGRGKVRDMYAVGDDKLLIVASDRISAFDVILDDPIPGKGQVLTELTEFWLQKPRKNGLWQKWGSRKAHRLLQIAPSCRAADGGLVWPRS